jgi:MFS family permease
MTNAQPHEPPAWQLGIAGLLSLAVAMGIGRFAFTPMLPLMLGEGLLDVRAGGWLAAANYAGYLAGALTASRMGWPSRRLGVVALLSTAVLTAAMAIEGPGAWWALLRFGAGVASAWAFVATSIWCLAALSRRAPSRWGTTFYAGVGAGITLAGVDGLAGGAAGWTSHGLWLQMGALALLLSIPVFRVLHKLRGETTRAVAAQAHAPMPPDGRALIACYAALGFGYILPATYLPVLARTLVDDPRLFGLAWPVFGITAAASTVVAARLQRRLSRLQIWAGANVLMAIGVALPGIRVAGWTIALSALLVGGTFMVVTLAGVQEVRARAAGDATRLVGAMTAAFATGQIAGPVASSLLLHVFPAAGLSIALQLGAASLVASAAWLWRLSLPSHPPTVDQEPCHVR